MQGFTLFDLNNATTFQLSTGSSLSKTFYFDDYQFVVQGTSKTETFSGCANTIPNSACSVVIDHYDALNCPIYKYYSKNSNTGTCLNSTRYEPSYSGGARFMTENYGCFWRGYLYYKDQLIKNFTGPFVNPDTGTVAEQYNQYIEGRGYTKGSDRLYLTQDGRQDSNYFYYLYFGGSMQSGNTCQDLDGNIRINAPPEQFKFELAAPTAQLYTSDTAQITVKVTQSLARFTGKLIVEYEVPTTIGSAKKTVSTDIVVNKGINTYSITIPTEQVTDQIKITPALELYYDTSAWTGYSSPYFVGRITGDIQAISIRPMAEREVIALQGQLLTAEEQIQLLQASIERKALIIENISELLDDQGRIIAQLDLSVAENAQLIQQLSTKVSDQAKLLASMNNTIQENVQIIAVMNAKIADQLRMIDELTSTQAEKDAYIATLLSNIAGQNTKIAELSSLMKINSDHILKMNATIQQQVQTIAALNVNLQEKEKILAEVYTKLSKQDERVQFLLQAIEQLQLDNGDIANLLNSYDTRLQDDALLISSLTLSNGELTQLVSGYKNNLAKEQELVSQLGLDSLALKEIIQDYEQRLILQQDITHQLQLSNAQLDAEIASYKANIITAEQLIQSLNTSNQDLTAIVADYDQRLDKMAEYIAKLNLTNEQLLQFLKALSDENEYQKQLLDKISQQDKMPSSKVLAGIVILLVCVLAYVIYKKRK